MKVPVHDPEESFMGRFHSGSIPANGLRMPAEGSGMIMGAPENKRGKIILAEHAKIVFI
jgi:hypothetical protein